MNNNGSNNMSTIGITEHLKTYTKQNHIEIFHYAYRYHIGPHRNRKISQQESYNNTLKLNNPYDNHKHNCAYRRHTTKTYETLGEPSRTPLGPF